ncbi:hypothetical protein [Burkholderia gladioli]|uniref:hypothetical protein n=1 Tax=Burkholderia gladioli TaxID=28095 RepID=UPI00163EA390|nr:hypothetical protein [Burkholderia gladioli]
MSKYTKLDALILSNITQEPTTFMRLYGSDIANECERIAMGEPIVRGRDPEPFRILDRRLQALRKAGKIWSSTKGWTLAARDGGGS